MPDAERRRHLLRSATATASRTGRICPEATRLLARHFARSPAACAVSGSLPVLDLAGVDDGRATADASAACRLPPPRADRERPGRCRAGAGVPPCARCPARLLANERGGAPAAH